MQLVLPGNQLKLKLKGIWWGRRTKSKILDDPKVEFFFTKISDYQSNADRKMHRKDENPVKQEISIYLQSVLHS